MQIKLALDVIAINYYNKKYEGGDFLKRDTISIKRFFLNLGLLGFIISVLVMVETFKYNLTYFEEVKGTVVDYKTEEYDYYINGQNGHERYQLPIVEYEYQGKKYTESAFYAENMSYEDVKNMKIGDTATFVLEKGKNHLSKPNDYYFSLIFLIPSLILIIICAGAFKNYKRDFIIRYKKAIIFTIISDISIIIYGILDNQIKPTEYGGITPGLDQMGDAINNLIFILAIQIIVLIVWIIEVSKFINRNKKNK